MHTQSTPLAAPNADSARVGRVVRPEESVPTPVVVLVAWAAVAWGGTAAAHRARSGARREGAEDPDPCIIAFDASII